jgi:hypothetical protein
VTILLIAEPMPEQRTSAKQTTLRINHIATKTLTSLRAGLKSKGNSHPIFVLLLDPMVANKKLYVLMVVPTLGELLAKVFATGSCA